MNTGDIANVHVSEDKTAENNRLMPLDPLDSALENSIRELMLLAKYYQKHGYLIQAQEIYYYILSIQERRDKRKDQKRDRDRVPPTQRILNSNKSARHQPMACLLTGETSVSG